MKKIVTALNVVMFSVCFVSCKKDAETPAGAADIQGTWNFVSMNMSSTSTAESSGMGSTTKTVTETDYVTQNNSGVVTIDASTMASSALTYSVNTTLNASYYIDGALLDEFEMPFTYTSPASNGTSSYRVVGSDSIYFESGAVVFSNGVTAPSTPSGAKFRVEGNMLYLTQIIKQTTSQVISGMTVTNNIDAVAEISLQKQ